MHTHDPAPTLLLERVREGMAVLDARGERVGSVAFVKMGDPEAVTLDGNEPLDQDTSPDVPTAIRKRLLRVGYIRISRAGLLAGDEYVAADAISRVDGDTVHLAPAEPPSPPPPPAPPSSTSRLEEPHAYPAAAEQRSDHRQRRRPAALLGGILVVAAAVLLTRWFLRRRQEQQRASQRVQRLARRLVARLPLRKRFLGLRGRLT